MVSSPQLLSFLRGRGPATATPQRARETLRCTGSVRGVDEALCHGALLTLDPIPRRRAQSSREQAAGTFNVH